MKCILNKRKLSLIIIAILFVGIIIGCKKNEDIEVIPICNECIPLVGKYNLTHFNFTTPGNPDNWLSVPFHVSIYEIEAGYLIINQYYSIEIYEKGNNWSIYSEPCPYEDLLHHKYFIVNDSTFKSYDALYTYENICVFNPPLSEYFIQVEEIVIDNFYRYKREY